MDFQSIKDDLQRLKKYFKFDAIVQGVGLVTLIIMAFNSFKKRR